MSSFFGGPSRSLWAMWMTAACLACALAWSGCSGDKKQVNASGQQAKSDEEFQSGANRPPSANTLYSMARILAAQGKDNECEYVLNRIIKEYPDFVAAYISMAELRMRQDRIEDAITTLSAGLKLMPKSSTIMNDLGMCWLMKSENEKALEQFSQAASLSPENARYRSNMAVALGMMGRYDESLSLFIQVVPTGEAHYNLCVLCEARKDYRRAFEEYEKAVAAGFKPPKSHPEETSTTNPAME